MEIGKSEQNGIKLLYGETKQKHVLVVFPKAVKFLWKGACKVMNIKIETEIIVKRGKLRQIGCSF